MLPDHVKVATVKSNMQEGTPQDITVADVSCAPKNEYLFIQYDTRQANHAVNPCEVM